MTEALKIADKTFKSRLFLGTAGYPNRQVMLNALAASGAAMATASIRRISLGRLPLLVDAPTCDGVVVIDAAQTAFGHELGARRLRAIDRPLELRNHVTAV